MNISEGRLTNELAINRAGEQGKLETALAYMQVHLKVMLDELQMTARAQAEETMHMQQRIAELFNRMAAGNESVSQISSAVEELSASIEQVAGHAEETARLSIDTSSSVAQSNADMNTSQQRTLAASQSVEQAQEGLAVGFVQRRQDLFLGALHRRHRLRQHRLPRVGEPELAHTAVLG